MKKTSQIIGFSSPRNNILLVGVFIISAMIGCHTQYINTIFSSPDVANRSLDQPMIHERSTLRAFSPRENVRLSERCETPLQAASKQIRPSRTPWGTPGDRSEIVNNLDDLLIRHGIDSQYKRVRLIAHAVIASGWRQAVWHHNLWGVKRGSWDGPWYEMSTTETNDQGKSIVVNDETWRAFNSWETAIFDYHQRVTTTSKRPSYRKAAKHLVAEDRRSDGEYWMALGEGNYYTARAFTPKRFAILCDYVRKKLSESKDQKKPDRPSG